MTAAKVAAITAGMAIVLWTLILVFVLVGCSSDGLTAHRVTCTDRPTNAPIASA